MKTIEKQIKDVDFLAMFDQLNNEDKREFYMEKIKKLALAVRHAEKKTDAVNILIANSESEEDLFFLTLYTLKTVSHPMFPMLAELSSVMPSEDNDLKKPSLDNPFGFITEEESDDLYEKTSKLMVCVIDDTPGETFTTKDVLKGFQNLPEITWKQFALFLYILTIHVIIK